MCISSFLSTIVEETVLSPTEWSWPLYFIRIVLKDKRAMSSENLYLSVIMVVTF